jgi:hypothetical protein
MTANGSKLANGSNPVAHENFGGRSSFAANENFQEDGLSNYASRGGALSAVYRSERRTIFLQTIWPNPTIVPTTLVERRKTESPCCLIKK